MVEYVVKEYKIDKEGNETVEVRILTDKAAGSESVWDLIQSAKENDRKVSIFRVGDCLLDFS